MTQVKLMMKMNANSCSDYGQYKVECEKELGKYYMIMLVFETLKFGEKILQE
jgi:hypothetical protein